MNSIAGWSYMLLGALFNGGASILLKHAAMQEAALLFGRFKLSFAFMASAMVCYVCAFGLYYLALKRIEVGTAYLAMTTIAAVFVNLYGHYVFADAFGMKNWLGAGFIALGLVFIFR